MVYNRMNDPTSVHNINLRRRANAFELRHLLQDVSTADTFDYILVNRCTNPIRLKDMDDPPSFIFSLAACKHGRKHNYPYFQSIDLRCTTFGRTDEKKDFEIRLSDKDSKTQFLNF